MSLVSKLTACLLGLAAITSLQAQEEFDSYIFTMMCWNGTERFFYTSVAPISLLEARPELADQLRVQPGRNATTIQLNKSVRGSNSVRSRPQRYVGPQVIEFFERAPKTVISEGPEGEMIVTTEPSPIARVTLPKDADRFLLLFSERDEPTEDGLEYAVTVFNDTKETFPIGSYRIINLAPIEIGMRFGSFGSVRLKPGRVQVFKPDMEERGSVNIQMFKLGPEDDRRPDYSARWFHEPNVRVMLLLRIDRRGHISRVMIGQDEDDLERPPE
ncbi:MAG: hypothetical protein ACFBZ8_04585 [Opitutales bacterium]